MASKTRENDDFDAGSNCILVADHAGIAVNEVTETVLDTEFRYTEVSIPIPEMNTEELERAAELICGYLGSRR